jgi:hypothetical protein
VRPPETLVRTTVHAVKADQVATFLGRRLDPRCAGEVEIISIPGIQGTRIKHHMGRAALKMYDKFGQPFGSRPPRKTSRFSSTTSGWNTATEAGR